MTKVSIFGIDNMFEVDICSSLWFKEKIFVCLMESCRLRQLDIQVGS